MPNWISTRADNTLFLDTIDDQGRVVLSLDTLAKKFQTIKLVDDYGLGFFWDDHLQTGYLRYFTGDLGKFYTPVEDFYLINPREWANSQPDYGTNIEIPYAGRLAIVTYYVAASDRLHHTHQQKLNTLLWIPHYVHPRDAKQWTVLVFASFVKKILPIFARRGWNITPFVPASEILRTNLDDTWFSPEGVIPIKNLYFTFDPDIDTTLTRKRDMFSPLIFGAFLMSSALYPIEIEPPDWMKPF